MTIIIRSDVMFFNVSGYFFMRHILFCLLSYAVKHAVKLAAIIIIFMPVSIVLAAPKNKDPFLSAGWHLHVGALYNMNNSRASMRYDINVTTPTGDPVAVGSGKFSDVSTGHSLDIVAGVGKVFNNVLYFGIESDIYVGEKTRFSSPAVNDSFQVGGTSDVFGRYTIRPMIDVGLKAGYIIGKLFMPYFKAGLSKYDVIASPLNYGDLSEEEISILSAGLRQNKSVYAPYIGVGVDFKLAKHVFLRGEYTYTNLSASKSFHDTVGATKVDAYANERFDAHNLKAGVVFIL